MLGSNMNFVHLKAFWMAAFLFVALKVLAQSAKCSILAHEPSHVGEPHSSEDRTGKRMHHRK